MFVTEVDLDLEVVAAVTVNQLLRNPLVVESSQIRLGVKVSPDMQVEYQMLSTPVPSNGTLRAFKKSSISSPSPRAINPALRLFSVLATTTSSPSLL